MILASAYPSSNISVPMMTTIAVVMVGSLAIWIALVYLAASERGERRGRKALGTGTLAEPAVTTDRETTGAGRSFTGDKHGVAA